MQGSNPVYTVTKFLTVDACNLQQCTLALNLQIPKLFSLNPKTIFTFFVEKNNNAMVEETKNETSKTYRSKIILSRSKVFGPKPKLFGKGQKREIHKSENFFLAKPKVIRNNPKYFGPIARYGRKPMIAWKPMVVYGGPNYLHRPWGSTKPNTWGRTNPVAWGPPQLTNIETSGFDAPNVSDYLDDYEQGNLLKGFGFETPSVVPPTIDGLFPKFFTANMIFGIYLYRKINQ